MILPSWVLPVAGFTLLVGSHWFAYDQGVTAESTRQQLVTTGAALAGQTAARAAEQVQAQTTIEAVKDAQTDLAALPDVRPELDRLRKSNDSLRGLLSSASAAAQRGETATSAAMVLSELLDRAQARIEYLEGFTGRAVELAERYDDALIRGQLAERLADEQHRAAQQRVGQ